MADDTPGSGGPPQQDRVTIADRYELRRKLARGGMAEVFVGVDTALDRPVAVKIMFPEFASDPSFVERFRREAQAAANLSHPNVVSVYDWGPVDNTYFIVMEYVEGRSLADIVRESAPINPDRAAAVTADVASALAFAHRSGLVHRDVTLANVLIDERGVVKVADFGIARAITGPNEDLTRTGTVMGTATYFSPEQAQGRPVDPRSDLYSLGVVLYQMLTGRPPFSGDTPVAVATKHVNEPVPPPRSIVPGIPTALEAICLKLLAKNADLRYASGEDLRADLARFRNGEPVNAERELEEIRARRAARRAAAAGAAAGAGAAVAAGMGATAATPAVEATRVQSAIPPAQPPPTEPTEPEKKRSAWPFVVVGLLLLVGLAALLFAINSLLTDDDEGDLIAMPNVVDMPVDEAILELVSAGFDRDQIIQEPPTEETEAEPGTVLAQDPAADEEVPLDSEITLQVVPEPGLILIPVAIIDVPEAEARTALEEAGFDLALVDRQEQAHDDITAGNVINSEPAAGTEHDPTARLTLLISSGPGDIEVPNLLGLTEEQARAELGEDFVIVVRDREVPFGSDDVGRVVDQDPDPNATATQGDTVTMFIGLEGPEPTTTTEPPTTTTTTTTTTLPPTTV